ncbi:MAG: DNA-binding protein HU, partial [Thiothrix sp.]
MNKTELIDAVSAKSGLTKADTDRAFKAMVEAVTEALAKGDQV